MFHSYFFFFSSRRRHTRCGRDWSSDVCSSDLVGDSLRRIGSVKGGSGKGYFICGCCEMETTGKLAPTSGSDEAFEGEPHQGSRICQQGRCGWPDAIQCGQCSTKTYRKLSQSGWQSSEQWTVRFLL